MTTQHSDLTGVIDRYFDLATAPDPEPFFAQFADDAVVEDDGRRHDGIAAVRAWRTSVPAVSYRVRSVAPTDAGGRAVAEISGDFPGSPVDLAFTFALDGTTIRALTIAPVPE